ncbi:MAG: DUF3868 domain-containing protein [Alistipes sp.]|nr:DUF3868 domain-containing protein [Alistipes sp.]
MKRILLLFALLTISSATWAQRSSAVHMLEGMRISDVAIEHDGEMLYVEMRMELQASHIKGRRARIYTPVLSHATHSIELPSVGVFGREHYYVDRRQKLQVEDIPDEWRLRRRDLPAVVSYYAAIPYQQWMNGATLHVNELLYGCRNRVEALGEVVVAKYSEWVFTPEYVDVKPTAKAEMQVANAFVDFPLMDANIDPKFSDNAAELAVIDKFFASFCDSSKQLSAIHIVGYASPDGEYEANAELAQQRAEALRSYIMKLGNIPLSLFTLNSVSEDWTGVIEWLNGSTLKNKAAIVEIIKGTMTPDEKEHAISSRYPQDFEVMLAECYPPLRRATYRVDYKVCDQMLDAASKSINAANAAMQRGDLVAAKSYLQSAGTSPLADYARALYAIHTGNLKEGVALLNKVKSSVPQAAKLLKQMTM